MGENGFSSLFLKQNGKMQKFGEKKPCSNIKFSLIGECYFEYFPI